MRCLEHGFKRPTGVLGGKMPKITFPFGIFQNVPFLSDCMSMISPIWPSCGSRNAQPKQPFLNSQLCGEKTGVTEETKSMDAFSEDSQGHRNCSFLNVQELTEAIINTWNFNAVS